MGTPPHGLTPGPLPPQLTSPQPAPLAERERVRFGDTASVSGLHASTVAPPSGLSPSAAAVALFKAAEVKESRGELAAAVASACYV